MKQFKSLFRWLILGAVFFFLIHTFKDHWQEIVEIRINNHGRKMLFLAFITTIIAHIFSGLVWLKILNILNCSLNGLEALKVYLITNIAKYLPGNVWHFYGRIKAVTNTGTPLTVASLSVLLEPLLMAAAALLIVLITGSLGLIKTAQSWQILTLQVSSLIIVLIGIHPRIINPVLQKISRSKNKTESAILQTYPLIPLLGEIGFLLLRGTGFLLIFNAFLTINIQTLPLLLGVFSFAWLLGFIIPGAPGGMGVFEATAIATLDETQFPTAIILSVVALFRIISITAEGITALICWFYQIKKGNDPKS